MKSKIAVICLILLVSCKGTGPGLSKAASNPPEKPKICDSSLSAALREHKTKVLQRALKHSDSDWWSNADVTLHSDDPMWIETAHEFSGTAANMQQVGMILTALKDHQATEDSLLYEVEETEEGKVRWVILLKITMPLKRNGTVFQIMDVR